MEDLKYVKDLVERSRSAQQILEKYNQEQVDLVVKTVGKAIFDNAGILAEEAVAETGMGNVSDKIRKQKNISSGHWYYMKGKKSVGLIDYDAELQVATYAKPIGVLSCITPTTNPTSTVAGNGMAALKSRNSMIVCPHPKAKRTTAHGVQFIREALKTINAPEDLIQVIEEPTIEVSQILMTMTDANIATGGPDMVHAAYSSGKPSFGVGPGNVQSIMDRGCEDLHLTWISGTIGNKTMDNGVQCTGEQTFHIPVDEEEAILEKFRENGLFVINDDNQIQEIREKLFAPGLTGELRTNPIYVGKSALELSEMWNLGAPENTKLLVIKASGTAPEELLCKEKLCPIISYLTYDTFEDAVEHALTNLKAEGAGHSSCMFSKDQGHIDYAANILPVTRLIINNANNVAGGNSHAIGLNPTISLGCGTWGGNSLSENLNYQHLMNKTRVATPLKTFHNPTFDEIWSS